MKKILVTVAVIMLVRAWVAIERRNARLQMGRDHLEALKIERERQESHPADEEADDDTVYCAE